MSLLPLQVSVRQEAAGNAGGDEKYGVSMKNRKDVTLESEYDKVKSVDIENWENKRGPRPWEEQEDQPTTAKH